MVAVAVSNRSSTSLRALLSASGDAACVLDVDDEQPKRQTKRLSPAHLFMARAWLPNT
jgi:hypothetical protein